MVNSEALFAEFEEMGEAAVRDRVDRHVYNEDRHQLAVSWLGRKAQARMAALEEEARLARAEEIELARRAASAAEAAAASAREANEVARAANSLASTANSLSERSNNQSRAANSTAKLALIASAISAIVAILALTMHRG